MKKNKTYKLICIIILVILGLFLVDKLLLKDIDPDMDECFKEKQLEYKELNEIGTITGISTRFKTWLIPNFRLIQI